MKTITGNFANLDGAEGRVILKFRQSSEMSVTFEKMLCMGGNGTIG